MSLAQKRHDLKIEEKQLTGVESWTKEQLSQTACSDDRQPSSPCYKILSAAQLLACLFAVLACLRTPRYNLSHFMLFHKIIFLPTLCSLCCVSSFWSRSDVCASAHFASTAAASALLLILFLLSCFYLIL